MLLCHSLMHSPHTTVQGRHNDSFPWTNNKSTILPEWNDIPHTHNYLTPHSKLFSHGHSEACSASVNIAGSAHITNNVLTVCWGQCTTQLCQWRQQMYKVLVWRGNLHLPIYLLRCVDNNLSVNGSAFFKPYLGFFNPSQALCYCSVQ